MRTARVQRDPLRALFVAAGLLVGAAGHLAAAAETPRPPARPAPAAPASLAIEGAKQKEVLAAASLAYLPEHPAAAAALREALASKDEQFVERLKKTISAQPPRRTRR